MTEPEDGEWLARRLIERCGCYLDRNECCDLCQGAAMVRRVCAQLAAAREDSARLDALERLVLADVENGGEPAALTLIHWGVGENKGWYIGGGIDPLPTFRAALDTARSTDAERTHGETR